jgi:23S rRNA (guanosine2251-2'-O)-methyltransferase
MTKDHQHLLFGVNPVLEALKAPSHDIVEIFLSETSDRTALRLIDREAQRRNVRIVCVDPKILDQLAGGHRHQGVVARVKAYRYLPFTELIERVAASEIPERILILDGLTDPRNFGALIRSANATGVRYIVIPKDRSVDVTPVVAKAAAGATSHVNIIKVTNLRRAILDLKAHGFWTVGLDAKSRETIYEADFSARLAIVLGSEGTGVRPINLRECDFSVSIPMLGAVSSLNVSVAGAVFLYELLRQARAVARGPGGPTR